MKAKKLIETAMPTQEISAESVRDKSIRHGHVSTLHLWWARRPLPACRAITFASIVPDPLDASCPQAFRDAVADVLHVGTADVTDKMYKPYADIPYTAVVDPMADNLRNRLMMFIGKFSQKCQDKMIADKTSSPKGTTPKEQIADGSLIKWESRNNKDILRMARLLVYVAYNAERDPHADYARLRADFDKAYQEIADAEEALYAITNRHLPSQETGAAEKRVADAITAFQSRMPAVFDPFAGGAAIPLEAARLGCRSFGNDINPVAHIIERASAEYPQRYGKPITMTVDEFRRVYGDRGMEMLSKATSANDGSLSHDNDVCHIANRMAFDVEYYAGVILDKTEAEVGHLYPADSKGKKPIAYYWARTATCSNPSCQAQVPLLRQFYLANTSHKHVYLKPIINGTDIQFEIVNGTYDDKIMPGWSHRGNLTCPCCGSVTDVKKVKEDFRAKKTGERMIAVITEDDNGKYYRMPEANEIEQEETIPKDLKPLTDKMEVRNIRDLKIPKWGISNFGEMFSPRQLYTLQSFVNNFNALKQQLQPNDYNKALLTFLAIWIDRLALVNTSLGRWDVTRENIANIFSRQAIAMVLDYPESNPFCGRTGSAINQLEWVLRYIEAESGSPFAASFTNASSGEVTQFAPKSITAVVTDPPYYDAIAYADISDFFYVWLKRTLADIYPLNFSTPQTPKADECTALKHHHNGSEDEARHHFERKLSDILSAIEKQTSDLVSVMFAHQSTAAWTTLCNAILNARMNITASWPLDTEMKNRSLGLSGAALESSVTVSCRPATRADIGDYREVRRNIEHKVHEEVDALYDLGFRGADLLTACFGQAAGEFGNYMSVEKGDGTPVSLGELLELARDTAFNAFISGLPDEPLTRFYVGWLYINGAGECRHDDVNKFTRVGVDINMRDVERERLVVVKGDKTRIANAKEHIGTSYAEGTHAGDAPITQAHRAMLLNREGERRRLLRLVRDIAPDDRAPLWRLLATLKELLPPGDDMEDTKSLLQNAATLRRDSKTMDDKTPIQTDFLNNI